MDTLQLIAVYLGRQIEFDADPKSIQQIENRISLAISWPISWAMIVFTILKKIKEEGQAGGGGGFLTSGIL